MQPLHQINYTDAFLSTVLKNVALASSYGTLPDDGDYIETCWIIFNVNFNNPFKEFILCISW